MQILTGNKPCYSAPDFVLLMFCFWIRNIKGLDVLIYGKRYVVHIPFTTYDV